MSPAPLPIIRSCRSVIELAGRLALAVAADPQTTLDRLHAINPEIGRAAEGLTDAVMDLDYRTNYLGGTPAPPPAGPRHLASADRPALHWMAAGQR